MKTQVVRRKMSKNMDTLYGCLNDIEKQSTSLLASTQGIRDQIKQHEGKLQFMSQKLENVENQMRRNNRQETQLATAEVSKLSGLGYHVLATAGTDAPMRG
ncbi:hypothetical protein NDU88_001419 [Pleurodeles waltl]|uniref:Uncharacterized protein n=1 Tax=Pleurodeles waltl TaxID=8319 RepID=A0AAV7L9F2_PLEWA|nr:hypothetical protein NDU88_001419 [Pleurodeles waltl]